MLPPSSYAQEKHKIEQRWPAAVEFIKREKLNETFDGESIGGKAALTDIGIVLQGGMYNAVIRGLQQLGLADAFGASQVPLYVMNVTYPLIPDELTAFCSTKKSVLVVEEGQPNYIEDALHAILRRADVQTRLYGKEAIGVPPGDTGRVPHGRRVHRRGDAACARQILHRHGRF